MDARSCRFKQAGRRVYSAVSRLELTRYLALFDFPDPNVTAERPAGFA